MKGETDINPNTVNSNGNGKLSIGLGVSKGISISAGILICHHKEPLSQMLRRAHSLLDEKAKNEMDRNACAIELKKRSGGSRYLNLKWDSMDNISQQLSTIDVVSTSLIYRLEKFRNGIEAILKKNNYKDLLKKFFQKQLERSGEKNAEKLAEIFVKITIYEKDNVKQFEPERLIVASFLSNNQLNKEENGQ